ncbi:MAG TPA: ankyrin repeat domain-containing protein [Flavobacterium sp.]|mgnify:CR=1 FL=1|nr:ankyrin repeat domain-containing protein [Flavobacterium sp.]
MKRYAPQFLLFFLVFTSFSQVKNVFDVARKGTVTEIKALYQVNPSCIDSLNDAGNSPLILAAYKGNTEVALFLADKVKDINYNSGMGTALMAAVIAGNEPIISKLISLKADLNQYDAQMKTALIYATFFDKTAIVKLLLKAGVDKTQKDNDNRTALDYATFNKNTELIILLDH